MQPPGVLFHQLLLSQILCNTIRKLFCMSDEDYEIFLMDLEDYKVELEEEDDE